MKQKYALLLVALGIAGILKSPLLAQKYQPTFESLEKVNPVPEWFKDAKFGKRNLQLEAGQHIIKLAVDAGFKIDKMVFEETN